MRINTRALFAAAATALALNGAAVAGGDSSSPVNQINITAAATTGGTIKGAFGITDIVGTSDGADKTGSSAGCSTCLRNQINADLKASEGGAIDLSGSIVHITAPASALQSLGLGN